MRIRPYAALLAAALPLGGCLLDVGPDDGSPAPPAPYVPPATAGSITVRWLVGGSTHPSACDAYGATDALVVIYDAGGQAFAQQTAPCSDFGITVQLPEGTYDAEVTLTDAANNGVSPTQPIPQLEVVQGTDLAVDVNFPL